MEDYNLREEIIFRAPAERNPPKIVTKLENSFIHTGYKQPKRCRFLYFSTNIFIRITVRTVGVGLVLNWVKSYVHQSIIMKSRFRDLTFDVSWSIWNCFKLQVTVENVREWTLQTCSRFVWNSTNGSKLYGVHEKAKTPQRHYFRWRRQWCFDWQQHYFTKVSLLHLQLFVFFYQRCRCYCCPFVPICIDINVGFE